MSCIDQNIGRLIGGYELGLLSEEERRQFENHLIECKDCFQSLYETAPITSMIREGKLAPSKQVKFHNDKSKVPSSFFRRKWALATAGVLAIMIIAYVIVWFQSPGEKIERLRGHDDVSILVLSPVGEVSTLSELKWKPVAGVDLYEVKILTETGDLVWEGAVQETKAVLPDSINETLIRGRTYYWQVEAQSVEGGRLKSQMIPFKIRN
ncbi:MAG: zf-HC2 domain-containing protein [Candidatus Aminicenantes bacterium]|nr:MAG: zf-HC2 domain-containing protein [Candidatus Aminicenantes bacterium]